MVSLGFLTVVLISIRYLKKEGFSIEKILDLALYDIIGAIAGARLFYVLGYWRDYNSEWLRMFFVWEGGLSFFGGLVGVLAATYLFARKNKYDVWTLLDGMTPGVALGYAVGRVGCFLRGCCYGIECHNFMAVKFPHIPYPVYPTQLFELASGLLIFGIAAWLYKRRKYKGQVLLTAMLVFSVTRFLIGLLRYDSLHILGLSLNGWISVIIFIAAGVMLYVKRG